jgi:hypothetical protein
MEKIREGGIDVTDLENEVIRTRFPRALAPMIIRMNRRQNNFPAGGKREPLFACTTVSFRNKNGETHFGRNFDWMHDPCLILKIHGGSATSSVAVLDPFYLHLDAKKLENPSLRDRIGLLFAPYLVNDGMNEYGVAVSEMTADGIEPPVDPGKPDVTNNLILRLILDYARNTDEAVALVGNYNVHFPVVRCHFMIADAAGKSVVVEFVGGKMDVVPSTRAWQVSTNHLLSRKSEAESIRACPRYRKASAAVGSMGTETDLSGLLKVMSSVSVRNWTMWTSLYNLSTGEFHVVYKQDYEHAYGDDLEMR